MKTPAILDEFTLSEPQSAAALARGSDVAVTAGAGTGKTRTLVARYLTLLADGLPLRRIVAVTFTRKAAREMRNRVRQEIGRYLRQTGLNEDEKRLWQTYYNELDAARIGTIHNLCAEILRAHPAQAGIDPQFSVLDETQAALLVEEAAEAALTWAVEAKEAAPLFDLLREQQLQELIITLIKNWPAANDVISRLPPGVILDHWQTKLQESQADAVECLLANSDFINAQEILVQNQAHNPDDKAEVQRQIVLTALITLRGESVAGKLHNLLALGNINLSGGSQKSWPGGKEQLQAVKDALRLLREMFKTQSLLTLRLNEQDEATAAAMPAIYALYEQAQESYQALKEEREGLDFDDLEAVAVALLEQHKDVRDYWQSQVQALLVDEFQDTNEQQSHFIRLLCPDAGKLFIVGDAKQSIYRFRGADVTVFSNEKEQISQQDGDLIDLETSYRAHETLLHGMNQLLRPVLGDDSPDRQPWFAPFAPLKAGGTAVMRDLNAPFIEFHLTVGTKQEALPRAAAALAQRLVQLQRDHGLDYGDMAILCRASRSFQYYENAFDTTGIPYLTVAGKGFYDRPEIRDLLNALQAISEPHDDLALAGLLRSPACGISDLALYRLSQARAANQTLWDTLQQDMAYSDREEARRLQMAVSLIHDLQQRAGRTPAADLLKRFMDMTYYRAILRRVGQPRALRNVAKLLNDIHTSGLVSVYEFLEYVQTVRDSGTREGEARATSGGAVQIMSIHAAKGLEFRVVVLGDAASGTGSRRSIAVDPQLGILLPYKNDNDVRAASYEMSNVRSKEQDEAETARLLYVALTRAEQMLFINGTVRQNKSGSLSWKGWLKQLAEISGISNANLSSYDALGREQHTFDFSPQDTAVRAAIYEPDFPTLQGSPTAKTMPTVGDRPAASSLQESLMADPPSAVAGEETPQRVWQVVPTIKRPAAPAWVIGSLVHEALALWRFPGTGFDDWTRTRAQGYGITDRQQLRNAQTETAQLLRRFQHSALYQEIDKAQKRLHEIPYNYKQNGALEIGRIDLLYLTNGSWNLVDFKTDRVRDEAALNNLLDAKDYANQLRAYGSAVQQLLGVVPQLKLCLLNYGNEVRVLPLTAE